MELVGDDDRRVREQACVAKLCSEQLAEARLKAAEADRQIEATDSGERVTPKCHRPADERVHRSDPVATRRADGEAEASEEVSANEVCFRRTVRFDRVKEALIERVTTVGADKAAVADCGGVRGESVEQAAEEIGVGDAIVIYKSGDWCGRVLKS
jgi:hypothetical protein